jgi:RNA polymerase sigma factor (sigma-70 family)
MGRIRRWIFNQETAEDIFQEACLKFMSSGAVFVMPQAGTMYFCRILQNLIFEHAKRSARLEYRENLPEMVCDPQGGWERDMLLDQVAEAVRHLPADDQRLLADYLNAGHGSLKEIGKALHLPSSTMRYRRSRIIRRLRAMVEKDS